jgi:hypothetical protein
MMKTANAITIPAMGRTKRDRMERFLNNPVMNAPSTVGDLVITR